LTLKWFVSYSILVVIVVHNSMITDTSFGADKALDSQLKETSGSTQLRVPPPMAVETESSVEDDADSSGRLFDEVSYRRINYRE
jgi:hypothetical protein